MGVPERSSLHFHTAQPLLLLPSLSLFEMENYDEQFLLLPVHEPDPTAPGPEPSGLSGGHAITRTTEYRHTNRSVSNGRIPERLIPRNKVLPF